MVKSPVVVQRQIPCGFRANSNEIPGIASDTDYFLTRENELGMQLDLLGRLGTRFASGLMRQSKNNDGLCSNEMRED